MGYRTYREALPFVIVLFFPSNCVQYSYQYSYSGVKVKMSSLESNEQDQHARARDIAERLNLVSRHQLVV